MKFKTLLILIIVALTFSCKSNAKEKVEEVSVTPYPSTDLSPQDRARELLKKMTLEEKVGQMTQVARDYIINPKDISKYHFGSILSGGGSSPSQNTPKAWADMIDNYQIEALNTRLRIPLLYGTDSVHGHNNLKNATIFPHNIGLGATRNDKLVEEIAHITAIESRATGIHWNFAPSVSVPQHISWGRTYEGFSEDPDISGALGAAAVRGYQGKDISDNTRVIATAKHFVGDGGTTGGKDQGDTQVTRDVLVNFHAMPYRQSIKEGVKTVMATFNSWNGVKAHGSKEILNDILRDELGFKGLIVSDWAAIKQLPGNQGKQIEAAINAGIDMAMVPDDYQVFIPTLINLVETERVSMSRIDDAVLKILTLKFEMGLFENPLTDRSNIEKIGSYEHREIARQAVRESMVLLKNENQVFPIKDVTNIHVIGEKANDIGVQCGGWTMQWQGARGNITKGTTILGAIEGASKDLGINVTYGTTIPKEAELVILVMGENPYAEFEGDKAEPGLLYTDKVVNKTALDSGLPVITILVSGRPLIITEEIENWDALLAAWLPGTEGDGVADILFGKYPVTGKLSFTWPKTMNLYNLREQAKTANNIDFSQDILFPLGFGL